MSTMIALFLVLSALAGCAGETLTTIKNTHAPPPPPTATISVEIEEFHDVRTDGDGNQLAICSYALPVLRAEGGEPSEAVTAFNEQFASWRDNAAELARHAREDRELTGGATVYSDELRCTAYQTGRLVSVAGVHATYTGGAHQNTILLSWNFDLETGEFFDPGLLDEETGLREAVSQELARQAAQRAAGNNQRPQDLYWEDYEATLENWTSYAVSFDEEGMTVGFSPYELASYAAGPQVFQIPYDTLAPYLGDRGRALLGIE